MGEGGRQGVEWERGSSAGRVGGGGSSGGRVGEGGRQGVEWGGGGGLSGGRVGGVGGGSSCLSQSPGTSVNVMFQQA